VEGTREPMILVTVGTDHHPFDRLVTWVDAWSGRHPEVEVIVQYGTARRPVHAEGHDLVTAEAFRALLARADAVVCAGGPGAIMEARAHGILPIVVPRRAEFGEHVDDHQRAFATFMAERGAVTVVEEADGLVAELDRVLAEPTVRRIGAAADAGVGIERIGTLIDALVHGGRR